MSSIRDALYDLLGSVTITTKELGKTRIKPWPSQRLIIDTISEGLSQGVHEFCILKPRQVAATTTVSVIQLCWALMHPGIQGAIIADTTANVERLRRIFADLLESLPIEWRGPDHRLVQNNRNGMVFANKSVIDLMAAGSNPDLGASRALNALHATEASLWRSLLGVESLRASLARDNPNRLYIFESIANGVGNWFYDYWQECKEDTKNKRAIFLGFYLQPYYRIEQDDPDFRVYWDNTLTDDEKAKVTYVKQHYGHTVPLEAIAWRRRESEFRDPSYMDRMYPFTERECFIESGSSFFPAKRTLELAEALQAPLPMRAYRYTFDHDFLKSSLEPTRNAEEANLRVWEHPVNDWSQQRLDPDTKQPLPVEPPGVYVIGIDPSGGGGGDSDDHAVEVFRCYADCLVQVCEFQTNRPLTYQIAWVLAHLGGAYKDHTAILEITGVGAAVPPETFNLRRLAEMGMLVSAPGADPIIDMIGAVRWYLYQRPDTYAGGGSVLHWKTSRDNKAQIYSEFRDSLMLRRVEIRSPRLMKQLQGIVEDEGYIGASQDSREGDDLVQAAVMAHHPWHQRIRNDLLARGMTWDSVHRHPQFDNPNKAMSFIISQNMRGVWSKRQQREERF